LYCCLQLAEAAELVAARLLAAAELLVAVGPLTDAADGALLVHAESPFLPSETREKRPGTSADDLVVG
jgi:hypothetical protein